MGFIYVIREQKYYVIRLSNISSVLNWELLSVNSTFNAMYCEQLDRVAEEFNRKNEFIFLLNDTYNHKVNKCYPCRISVIPLAKQVRSQKKLTMKKIARFFILYFLCIEPHSECGQYLF